MTDLTAEIPVAEQEICVTCGFCCDGTLFNRAMLEPGEYGSLPQKIEEQYGKTDESEFFVLPCAYFCGKCTIYDQKRAVICGAFRCKLLKNFSKDQFTQADALQIIANAKGLRDEIFQLYGKLVGVAYSHSFMELLDELPALYQTHKADSVKNRQVNLLFSKCALLDTLLIKSFKSAKSFDVLVKSSMN